MMRRSGVLVLGLTIALAMALGAVSQARAGSPDDGSVDDPAVQAPAFSLQGPASGFGYAPAPPPAQSSSNQPSPPPPPPQQQSQPTDPTAVRAPSPTGVPFSTAQCHDGWFSYSQTRAGTCAGHQGVLVWITEPGTASGVLWERQEQAADLLGNGWVGSAPFSPVAAVGHTYYASSFNQGAAQASLIYCDTDPGWQQLSPTYSESYSSLEAAQAANPGYRLNSPC
jgi:Protein of unknown function (DUF3761)